MLKYFGKSGPRSLTHHPVPPALVTCEANRTFVYNVKTVSGSAVKEIKIDHTKVAEF